MGKLLGTSQTAEHNLGRIATRDGMGIRLPDGGGGGIRVPEISLDPASGVDRIAQQADELRQRQEQLERQRQQQQQAQKRQQALAEVNDKLNRIGSAISKAAKVKAKLQPLANSNFSEVKSKAQNLLSTLNGLVTALNNAKNSLNQAKAGL